MSEIAINLTTEEEIKKIVKIALEEDFALEDITSDSTILNQTNVNFEINSRENMVFCGEKVISEVFSQLKSSKKFKNAQLSLEILAKDGDFLKSGEKIAQGRADARLVFAGERVALNLIQHLSGIATITKEFVSELDDNNIEILDTRKTIPGLRNLQKYATLAGGGKNHRFNLSDLVLIKDNHIAAAGNIKNAIGLAKKRISELGKDIKIEVECDNFDQVTEVLPENPDIIMLDNMNRAEVKKCAELIEKYRKTSKKDIKIEVSGGINLKNIKNFANLDINYISIGYLTHSVKAVDIGLDIVG